MTQPFKPQQQRHLEIVPDVPEPHLMPGQQAYLEAVQNTVIAGMAEVGGKGVTATPSDIEKATELAAFFAKFRST